MSHGHRMWGPHASEEILADRKSRSGNVVVTAELDDGNAVRASLTVQGALDLAAELTAAARDAHRTELRIAASHAAARTPSWQDLADDDIDAASHV